QSTRHFLVSKYNTGNLKYLEDGHNFLRQVSEGPVCNRTLKRYQEKEGCFPGIKQRAPALTKKQMKDREDWAKDHIKWGIDEWKNVMFSDERIFERFGTGGR